MKSDNQIRWNHEGGSSAILCAPDSLCLGLRLEKAVTKVYEIDPLVDPRWAGLVESHPRASVFHSRNWLKTLKSVYGYEPVVITTCPPWLPLTNGLVFCRINSWLTGRRLVSLPFSDHCDPLTDSPIELDEILSAVRRYVDEDGWKYVEIRPSRCAPSGDTKLTRSLTYCLHSIDVRNNGEELLYNFHKACVQRKIRRAEREKLRYEEGRSDTLLQDFYHLLVITRRRQFLPPQPLAWFRGLVTAFGSDLKIRVVYKDQLPIAGIITVSHKQSMVYKYGGSDSRFHRFGGMQLLFWNAIREAKRNDFLEFDMGRSDVDNLGLIAFKEHWGANRAEISYWTYPHRPQERPIAWQKQLLRAVALVAPDAALRAVGNLLYQHIG